MERPKLSCVNENLTCGICRGYLIEATTVSTCLHSFCRSCIIKHLSKQAEGEELFCPTCLRLKSSEAISITTQDLRSDHLLQTVVYKLVPFLYESEQKRRLEYKKKIQGSGETEGRKQKKPKSKNISNHHGGETSHLSSPSLNFTIFCSSDVINVKLSEIDFNNNRSDDDKTDGDSDARGNKAAKCRYLLCPVMLRIHHLKKFLLQKVYNGTPSCNIIPCCQGRPLRDEFNLADVCYIFGLQKATCINIKYIAYTISKYAHLDGPLLTSQWSEETKIDDTSTVEQSKLTISEVVDANPIITELASLTSDRTENLQCDNKHCRDSATNVADTDDATPSERIDGDAGMRCAATKSALPQEDTAVAGSSSGTAKNNDNNNNSRSDDNDPGSAAELTTNIHCISRQVTSEVLEINSNASPQREVCADNVATFAQKSDEVEKRSPESGEKFPIFPSSVSSSSSSSSATTFMSEPSLPLALPTAPDLPATMITLATDMKTLDCDSISNSSSETTIASPIGNPASPVTELNAEEVDVKPCKVVLCRLPTACFLSSKKRKYSAGNDKDEIGGHSSLSKRPKTMDTHQQLTSHSLMIKYKNDLKKLGQLRRKIQILRSQERMKAKDVIFKDVDSVSLMNVDEDLKVNSAADVPPSDAGNTALSANTFVISSHSSTDSVTATVTTTCTEIEQDTIIASSGSADISSIPVRISSPSNHSTDISSPLKVDDHQPTALNEELLSLDREKDVNNVNKPCKDEEIKIPELKVMPKNPVEVAEQSSKPDRSINITSDLDAATKPKSIASLSSTSYDLSWIFKCAGIGSSSKIGNKVVDANALNMRSPGPSAPAVIGKSNFLDLVRLPFDRQKCGIRNNSLQGLVSTPRAIRSGLRVAVTTSFLNYGRSVHAAVANSTSEIEAIRNIIACCGSQSNDPNSNVLSMSPLELMMCLERNQTLLNNIPLNHQSFANGIPLFPNGCNLACSSDLVRLHQEQMRRHSVSTQTAQLDLINQYFCRRSKPVPSIFMGKTRPLHSKRSFGHAFGCDPSGKKTYAAPKRVHYANEGKLNFASSIAPILRDGSEILSYRLQLRAPRPLHYLPPVASICRHPSMTEMSSASTPRPQMSHLRPLCLSNQQRVICLTPPTEIQQKAMIYNGLVETSSNQALTIRPRSSSANAAEVYDFCENMANNVTCSIQAASPLVNIVQALTSRKTSQSERRSEANSEKKTTITSRSPNQLSPRQKDSFHSIPRKSLYPIFSRPSKLNASSLQPQTIFSSSRNGFRSSKECSALSVYNHPAPKMSPIPSSQLHITGNQANRWSITGGSLAVEPSSLIRNQDNNMTLDLSLSKKRKRPGSKLVEDALKSDFSKNSCRFSHNLGVLGGMKSFRSSMNVEPQGISSSAVLSCLSVSNLAAGKSVQSSLLKNEVPPNGGDAALYKCPNVIDFRKSLPIKSFKLCDLKNFPFSTLLPVNNCSNFDDFGSSYVAVNHTASSKINVESPAKVSTESPDPNANQENVSDLAEERPSPEPSAADAEREIPACKTPVPNSSEAISDAVGDAVSSDCLQSQNANSDLLCASAVSTDPTTSTDLPNPSLTANVDIIKSNGTSNSIDLEDFGDATVGGEKEKPSDEGAFDDARNETEEVDSRSNGPATGEVRPTSALVDGAESERKDDVEAAAPSEVNEDVMTKDEDVELLEVADVDVGLPKSHHEFTKGLSEVCPLSEASEELDEATAAEVEIAKDTVLLNSNHHSESEECDERLEFKIDTRLEVGTDSTAVANRSLSSVPDASSALGGGASDPPVAEATDDDDRDDAAAFDCKSPICSATAESTSLEADV